MLQKAFANLLIITVVGGTQSVASAMPHLDEGLYRSKYLQHPQPLADEFNYEKLKELITSQNLTGVASVIEALPPQMKNDNYVIMYRSRSLQHATPEQPRIITYTPSARLLVSFNGGDKKIKGHDSLEVIQFRDETARFEFHEIQFSEDEDSLPTFSESNPRKCMACHQSHERQSVDLRPNWEPYNIWPGAVGSKDGGILPHKPIEIDKRIRPYDRAFLDEQAREPEIIQNFLKLAKEHPRYQKLGSLNMNAPVALSELLAVLNFQRVVRLMKAETQVYSRHQDLLTYIGECKGSLISGLHEFYSARAPKEKYASYYANSLSEDITTLFEGSGVDTSDWSMDFGTQGRFALFERFGTPSNTRDVFSFAWSVANGLETKRTSKECEALRSSIEKKWSEQKAEIEASSPIRLKKAERTPRQILAICMNCHNSDDGFAPDIPYNNESQLIQAIRNQATTSPRVLKDEILYRTSEMATNEEQMPPTQRLSPSDRKTLAEYIESLNH